MTDSKRVEHDGGPCPVAADTRVKVWLRAGGSNNTHRAGYWADDRNDMINNWHWKQRGPGSNMTDIIAYAILDTPAQGDDVPMQSMSAEWLASLAGKIERGEKINPCPKALRRVAKHIEALATMIGRALGRTKRDGKFLDDLGCCKVCDGEIPDGHTENCDIWKLEKKHRDFIANEYNAVLIERDALTAQSAAESSEH